MFQRCVSQSLDNSKDKHKSKNTGLFPKLPKGEMAGRIWGRCGKFLSSTEGRKEKIMKSKGERYRRRQPTHKCIYLIITAWNKKHLYTSSISWPLLPPRRSTSWSSQPLPSDNQLCVSSWRPLPTLPPPTQLALCATECGPGNSKWGSEELNPKGQSSTN